MKIHASLEAGSYVRQRGGTLYMWFQPARRGGTLGFMKVSTQAPRGTDLEFTLIEGGAFQLAYDQALARPADLYIDVRRFPWRRLKVTGLGGAVGDDAGDDPVVHWWLTSGEGGGDGNGGGGNGG